MERWADEAGLRGGSEENVDRQLGCQGCLGEEGCPH